MRKTFIHPTACVASGAQIGQGVSIGPWCCVGANVTIEDNVELMSHVVIDGHTRLGAGSRYFPFCTVGMAPQDLKYNNEPTSCEIGCRTIVREHVTIHRGTVIGDGITRIGSDVLIMASAHVAHDCVIGDRVVIVNNVLVGGHVRIDEDARIMGAAAIHQFVRIGRAALVGGVTGVEADVIPYGSVLGNRARLIGLHWIWLRRHGVSSEEIHRLRRAFLTLYPKKGKKLPFLNRLESVRQLFNDLRIREIVEFIDVPSRRGLVRPAWCDMD